MTSKSHLDILRQNLLLSCQISLFVTWNNGNILPLVDSERFVGVSENSFEFDVLKN